MSSHDDPFGLRTYLNQIGQSPLLAADEERELARRVINKDPAARELMVRSNLRLVVSIARRYAGKGLRLPDLIGEGNVGLLRAVNRFDPERGCRFSTYASWWIKQAIKRALTNSAGPVHIPSYMVEMVSRVTGATRRLRAQLGRPPSPDELSERLKVPARKLRLIGNAIAASRPPAHSYSDDGERAVDEWVAEVETPHDSVRNREELGQLGQLLERVDRRTATVLQMRYGLGGGEPKTFREIGEAIGLTRERVRQIEQQALRVLRSGVGRRTRVNPARPAGRVAAAG